MAILQRYPLPIKSTDISQVPFLSVKSLYVYQNILVHTHTCLVRLKHAHEIRTKWSGSRQGSPVNLTCELHRLRPKKKKTNKKHFYQESKLNQLPLRGGSTGKLV